MSQCADKLQTVLSPGYVPLANRAGGLIGTLPAPTSTAQAKLLGFPGQLKAPQFSFKAASGAASGYARLDFFLFSSAEV